jgi:hypothetical protein
VKTRFGANAFLLGDYIDSAFFPDVNTPSPPRRTCVAFNPKKGSEYTAKLRLALPEVEFVALENLSRAQMIECLRTTQVYVDFGAHPGKDRIPREAALCGCVVVVARRGSASFWEDVPLDERYKLDVSNDDWVSTAASLLREVLRAGSSHRAKQGHFVAGICEEKEIFSRTVAQIFHNQGG